jgi:hypothetical protein
MAFGSRMESSLMLEQDGSDRTCAQ